MRAGIIGFGSIGKRHFQNLRQCGIQDVILCRSSGKQNEFGLPEVYDIMDLISYKPDFCIIANPTAVHYQVLTTLLESKIKVLVEKPVVATLDQIEDLLPVLKKNDYFGMVAYNTRFHPCVSYVQKIISQGVLGKIYSGRFFIGQFLPDWHPGEDYRNSYSSKLRMGGGVTLDLIHEIDLAYLFFGNPDSPIYSVCEKKSDLEIETEDCCDILYNSSSGTTVSIHMDYLCKNYRRYFEFVGEHGNLVCDFFEKTIKLSLKHGGSVYDCSFPEFERNTMYLDMLSYFLSCVKNNSRPVPDLNDGLKSLIIAIEARNKFVGGLK